ncbi:hypothetical protein B4U80_03254 [Leptotrombidium deliense]|uniref:Chitin-binding type-2 domain-containing protein n=1 Tax=Leptotrombidium deliense TaxID=299467 RepID=A0A443SS46_9ACAR|nr:hypothetical protein B4U80_03254 [Leptotrombidium deliense]
MKLLLPENKNGTEESGSFEQISLTSSREDPLQRILPKVKFDCTGLKEGYYPDVDFDCEVFHYCKTNGFRFTFVCPPKQRFNQRHMTCDFDPPGVKTCGKSSNDETSNSEQSRDYIALQSNNATMKESVDYKEKNALQEPSLSSSSNEKTSGKTAFEHINDPYSEYASSSQNWDGKHLGSQPSSLVDNKSLMQYMKEVSEQRKNSFREPEPIKNDRSNATSIHHLNPQIICLLIGTGSKMIKITSPIN